MKMHIFVLCWSNAEVRIISWLKAGNRFYQNRLVDVNEFCYQVKRVDIDKVLLVHKCHHNLLQLRLDRQQKPEVNVKDFVVI